MWIITLKIIIFAQCCKLNTTFAIFANLTSPFDLFVILHSQIFGQCLATSNLICPVVMLDFSCVQQKCCIYWNIVIEGENVTRDLRNTVYISCIYANMQESFLYNAHLN